VPWRPVSEQVLPWRSRSAAAEIDPKLPPRKSAEFHPA
jgi:hypothetical protein